MQIAKDLIINPQNYASQGNTILGIRGSGKSYTASKIAEEMLKKKIPILVFDPTNVWHNLRNGINGNEGFPIVVVGGIYPDIPLPLDEENMEGIVEKVVILVRAAMQNGISIVVDLFGMAKSNWQKIVIACVRLLLKENYLYGLRHVIFEEAAEVVPQRIHPGNQVVYGLIEQMARTGRNFGIGYTLINQRAEEIAKAVFELCEMVFVHRQKGKNSLKSIREWLDHQGIEAAKGLVASIPKLADGECWVISEDGEQRIKVLEKQTFHPSPKEGRVTVPHDVKIADRTSFIASMMAEMSKGGKDKTPLKQNKKSAGKEIPEVGYQSEEILVLHQQNDLLKQELSEEQRLKIEYEKLAGKRGVFITKLRELLIDHGIEPDPVIEPAYLEHTVSNNGGTHHFAIKKEQRQIPQNSTLAHGEKLVLISCTQTTNGLLRKEITVMCGYKQSARDTYISRLKQKGYLQQDGERLLPTKTGIKALGKDYQPLPTGKKLQEYWINKLSGGEQKIFSLLIKAYPRNVSRDYITESIGYKQSARDTYISRLSMRQLITIPGKGNVRASDFLFDKN